MDNRLFMLKHENLAGHQKYWKNLWFLSHAPPYVLEFSIKILCITNLLVSTALCGVHKPKVEHSILGTMIALRSPNPSLRKSSIDK